MADGVAGLLLAAGSSTRVGTDNKLLYTKDGATMLWHSATALRGSAVSGLLAVTGPDHTIVCKQLQELDFNHAYNPDHEQGMGSSLRVGLACLQEAAAVLVCLADMPGVQSSTLSALINCWQHSNKRRFVVPLFDGEQGNPVIIPAVFFAKFSQTNGDVGARSYMKKNPDSVLGCPVSDPNVLIDYDTREELLAAGWIPPNG